MKKIILSLLLAVGFMFQGCTQGEDGTSHIQWDWSYTPSSVYTNDPAFGSTIYANENHVATPGTYSYSFYSYDGTYRYGTYTLYVNGADGADDGADIWFEFWINGYSSPVLYDWSYESTANYAQSLNGSAALDPTAADKASAAAAGIVKEPSIVCDVNGPDYSNEEFKFTDTITKGKYTLVHKHN